jgi:hypothetical protein
MKFRFILGFVSLTLLAGCGAYEKIDTEYQKDADAKRVADLYQIAELVEEYRDKVGFYPLAKQRENLKAPDGGFEDNDTKLFYESNPEAECLITPRDVSDKIKNRPGAYIRVSYEAMNTELSKALGREVILPYDPQKVWVHRPNFYVYLYRDGNYYLAVHLHEPHLHSKKIAEHFYKLEVTSFEKHPSGIVNYRKLREKKQDQ